MNSQSFQRGLDPKRAMNIGQIALIKEWLNKHDIKNYTINEDFTIDVDGDVWLEGYHLNDVALIPHYIRFGKVNGKFVLTNNKQLVLIQAKVIMRDWGETVTIEPIGDSLGRYFQDYYNSQRDSTTLKSLIGNFPDESGFIKKFRLHQGWWRTFVLNEPEGVYKDAKGNFATVCNRINNGKASLKNFLSEDISDEVAKALEEQKQSGSGIMDEDRLYNNLLSSQPLAFNFFGFFNNNKDLALNFLKTIRPDITCFERVVFEYAPDSNKDSSAFDIAFLVKSGEKRGFIGLECKYTDTFSYRRKGGKVNYGDKSDIEEDRNYINYFKMYSEHRDRFPDDYFSYVRSKDYNQLFRNELLAVQLKPDFEFVVTGLFCHKDDKETINSGKEFQKKIGNGVNDFIILTYADYFERIQKLNLSLEQRELIMMLWARYCGLELSKELLNTT